MSRRQEEITQTVVNAARSRREHSVHSTAGSARSTHSAQRSNAQTRTRAYDSASQPDLDVVDA